MFAVWITGLPASGKSTIAALLLRELRARGLDPEVVESDVLREIATPRPVYDEEERSAFYRLMAHVGERLVRHGVPVIFDATANRRAYREHARERISSFIEVFVDCPVEVCAARDPKGLWKKAARGDLPSDVEDPETAARRIVAELVARGYLAAARRRG
jgi:adenylylsulfate kinase